MTPREGGIQAEGARGGQTTVHHHYYYGNGYAPGTYGQGGGAQGADLSGITNPATARSQGALTMTQAKNQSIENHNYAVSSYYQNKNIHDQYEAEQDSKTRMNVEETEKWDREATPGRMTSAQLERGTGIIHWPPFLRDKAFNDPRYKLDQLYHARTPDNSGADSDNYIEIKKNCEAMHDILIGMIKDIPPATYVAASHFIRSVTYEGRFAGR